MENKNKQYTIFVVDDSDVYRSVLMQALESDYEALKSNIRYKIFGFASGEECMAHAHLNPDIMIVDYLLDGNGYHKNMNGLELLRKIKSKLPRLHVIVLSCQNNIQVAKDFMREGIAEYIRKEGLGQHKVKQVVADVVQQLQKNYQRRNQFKYAAVILGLIALISAIIFSLA